MTVAVLFDLEDTLVQTPWVDHQRVLEFRCKAKEKLAELGIPPGLLEGVERATIMRNKSLEHVEKNFSETEAQKFHKKMNEFLRQYELDSAEKSKLFPDTLSTLGKIRKLGLRMGLVTNTSMEAVNTVFKLHSLGTYFDAIVTRERMNRLKPDPEGALLAAKELGARRFFMVGDLVHDALAAKNANGISIILRRNIEVEVNFHADYFVQSLSEVPIIIQASIAKTI
jgi:HAD superfamily hydrolase (TIGR01549 family)